MRAAATRTTVARSTPTNATANVSPRQDIGSMVIFGSKKTQILNHLRINFYSTEPDILMWLFYLTRHFDVVVKYVHLSLPISQMKVFF